MNEEDFQKLKDISKNLQKLNTKVTLIGLLKKAKTAYDENKNEECIKYCKAVLKTDSKNTSALRGMGCVMQAVGNIEKAIEYYNKALEYSKNKEIEYTLLGTIYYNIEDLDNAIKYFNLAIDANDNYDPAYEGKNQSMLENHLKLLDLQDSLIKQNLF